VAPFSLSGDSVDCHVPASPLGEKGKAVHSKLTDEINETMQNKTTEELLEIWTNNDRWQWSDAAFDAVQQILSDRNVTVPPQNLPITLETIPARYKGVRGWLRFFCITLTVFVPSSFLDALVKTTTSDIWHDFRPGFVSCGVLIFAGASIYVGVSLWRVRPKAVERAKVFLRVLLGLTVVMALLMFIGGSFREGAFELLGVVYPLIWLEYLSSSKRVRATYSLGRDSRE